jgi:hypothetical protein
MDFTLIKGDLLPRVRFTLQDEEGPIDLTGLASSDVIFTFQAPGFTGSGECAILVPLSGVIEFAWSAGDTDVAGEYLARIAVNFGGEIESFPNEDAIHFEILDSVPLTAPTAPAGTLVSDFYEPVRAFLGDHDDTLRQYEDRSIERTVRSLIQCGELTGYSLSTDRTAIVPVISDPKLFGTLVYKACKAFINPVSGGYSYRTRAISESIGDMRTFIFQLENALYALENGEMFSCWSNFYTWLNAVTGINVWSHLTDMEVEAPVATVTLSLSGMTVD